MNKSAAPFYEIIYETVLSKGNKLSVSMLCKVSGVSRSGYYEWLQNKEKRDIHEKKDLHDFQLILSIYQKRGYSKGARSIYMGLIHLNPPVIMNIKKIRRLMAKYNLRCPIRKANPYRRMAKALRTSNVADNLLNREFKAYGPRIVLLTDITDIRYNETFAYLSTIIDAYTKQILSYVLSDSLEIDFVLLTINQLIESHGISLNATTIINSDQGCHYTSHKFIELLKDKGLRQSMSRKGNCWDNAPQESFFGHMKDEINLTGMTEFEQIKKAIDDYIDYYNNERYQWDLAKLAPNEFYEFITTGIYPLDIPNKPNVPSYQKEASELGNIL